MATYNRSPYGTMHGRVYDLVAAQWKGVDYIREYTKPLDPKTVAQLAHRDDFKEFVRLAKWWYPLWVKPYWKKKKKQITVFNDFLHYNWDNAPDWREIYDWTLCNGTRIIEPLYMRRTNDPYTWMIDTSYAPRWATRGKFWYFYQIFDYQTCDFVDEAYIDVRDEEQYITGYPDALDRSGVRMRVFYGEKNGHICSEEYKGHVEIDTPY